MVLPILILVASALLIYSAVKGKNPINVVKETLGSGGSTTTLKNSTEKNPFIPASEKGDR